MAGRVYSPRPRRFEFEGGTSSKFWQISVRGAELHIRFGRIGTAGQTSVKTCSDAAKAEREADKLIRSKLAKGYLSVP